jgi:lycopene epsilon-cyclase
VDALVVGAGPAGLALASALAARGLTVTLLSRDAPFVNTYGVWVDEFEALGLGATLDATWPSAHCYFGEGAPTVVPRAYGRVDRAALRSVLVQRAADAGVRYLEGDLVEAGPAGAGDAASPLSARTADGAVLAARMVTLACGAAAGRLLTFAPDAPAVAAQTAYGVEATVTGWGAAADESNAPSSPAPAARRAHDPDAMLFMDFRRHHVGVWDGTAPALAPGNHPAGGDGLWGSEAEAPSFLYAMPSPSRHPDDPPGTRRVFLEETCLVARPPLPFATLKRRLHRRLAAAGVAVTDVHDEEWSYIPVGGPLPAPGNALTAFGVAGGLVHPATGYSVARSLAAADGVAAAAAAVLADPTAPPAAAAAAFWGALWPPPARAASAFHVFGMELLARLGPADTNAFFGAFFALPPSLWRGFLSASLSPASLVWFALATFVAAPNSVRAALVRHMLLDPSGRHLIGAYAGLVGGGKGGGEGKTGGGAATAW